MTKFYNRLNPRYNPALLRHIYTPLGPRAFYDSVSFCNRCGCCQQDCPAYRIFLQEPFSPRGRNQLIRLIMENKLNPRTADKQLRKILDTCILCGKCSGVCAGQIPTAEHILQLRRAIGKRALPFTLHHILRWRRTAPKLFNAVVKSGLLLRRTGILHLLGALHLLPAWLAHANAILPKKTNSLRSEKAQPQTPTLIYLPSMEVSYFAADTAHALLEKISQRFTPVVWHNIPSGLFSYVYERDVRLARMQLRRLIKRHAHTANGALPLLTDSIDVYLFLKKAPQLFAPDSNSQKRAQHFADCVRFVTDFISPEKTKDAPKTALDTSALLWQDDPVFDRTAKKFMDVLEGNFVECLYTGLSIAAGGQSFVNVPLAQEMGCLCVRRYAQQQVESVIVLSVLAQMEMSFLLKKFYPHATAHFVI